MYEMISLRLADEPAAVERSAAKQAKGSGPD